MTPSAWLSFSTELTYLAAVLFLLAVIAFKLAPLRALRYWWVRRERVKMRGVDPMQRLRLDAIVRMK